MANNPGNRNFSQPNGQYEDHPGAAHGDHITNTAAFCNASASHMYGNIAGVVEKYLLDRFPKELFNEVTMNTTLANRQMRHLPRQLHKKTAPIMVLSPRISFGQDEDRFLGHTLINDRITDMQHTWGGNSLIELSKDRKHHLTVHGHYNRALVYMDVVLSFDTFNEQMDYMSYLHNMIPINHNQELSTYLELHLPSEMVNLLGSTAGMKSEIVYGQESRHELVAYLNSTFHHPITYKLKGGSNTDEFFMYYMADIDMVVQSPTANPPLKDGQVQEKFDISFTVRCEFNTIGYFMINSPVFQKSQHLKLPEGKVISSLFTDQINLNDFNLPLGWQIMSWPTFKLNIGENSVSLLPILNDSLKAVIDYNLRMNINMDTVLNIQFRENGQILNRELFYIDWGKRELILTRPNTHRTYRLIISANAEYINTLIKEMYNLE